MTGNDNPFTEQQLEAGRKLFAGPCEFMLGVTGMEFLPPEASSEVAFAGRSNVGKSSLLNALTGRNALARTSNTPGRTRELNYFDLGGQLRLVDLPGYGYARASKKDAAAWGKLTRDFLRGRAPLRRVCVLIDSRHGLKPSDLEIADMLDQSAVNYQIILTKIDKIKPSYLPQLRSNISDTLKKRPASHPIIHATSSQTGEGLTNLRAELTSLV